MRVVVFGGGYAGIVAVRRLERRLPEDASILLVDRRSYHLVRHELHRVIRRPSVAEALQIPFDQILNRATFRQETVTALDPDAGTATFDSGETLEFDAGIVAFGAAPADYGIEGIAEHGTPLDRLEDAESIATSTTSILEQGTGTIVVGGAGLAGVQAAGELEERRATADAHDVSIILVEQANRIAPREPERFSTAVTQRLQAKGVELRTGTPVTGATSDTVETVSETIDSELFVWTGGINGSPALDGDRPRVRGNLRLGNRSFAAGDAISVIDKNGELVAPTAQSAVGMAAVAADNAIKLVEAKGGGFGPRYDRYRSEGDSRMVTIGDDAVARIGPVLLTGAAARTLKSVVGSRYLSTAGAIEEGVSLVRMEFDLAHPRTGATLPNS